jgi:hypothetical protein
MEEMRFLRAVEAYGMTDYKCNEDIRELGVADINTIIKMNEINGYTIWKEWLKT